MASLIGKALARSPLRNAAPVPMDTGGLYHLPGLAMGGNADETLMRAYASQGTVYANVSLLARATAGPVWKLFRKAPQDGRRRYTTTDQGSDQRVEVINHQALEVLNNPASVISWRQGDDVLDAVLAVRDLARSGWRRPASPLGRRVRPAGELPGGPVAGAPRPDDADPGPGEVPGRMGLHGAGRPGADPARASTRSSTTATRTRWTLTAASARSASVLVDIDAARYAAEWNRNFFLNSAEPGGVLQADHALEDDEYNALMNRWREAHKGVSPLAPDRAARGRA